MSMRLTRANTYLLQLREQNERCNESCSVLSKQRLVSCIARMCRHKSDELREENGRLGRWRNFSYSHSRGSEAEKIWRSESRGCHCGQHASSAVLMSSKVDETPTAAASNSRAVALSARVRTSSIHWNRALKSSTVEALGALRWNGNSER